MDFNIKFYGSYAIYTDKTPALPLDFTAQYERLLSALDEETSTCAGGDIEGYKSALEGLKAVAAEKFAATLKFNNNYAKAKNDGVKEDQLVEMRSTAAEMNKDALASFKFA